MGPGRLELPTSRLSGVRSSQLSYEPVNFSRLPKGQMPGGRLEPNHLVNINFVKEQ